MSPSTISIRTAPSCRGSCQAVYALARVPRRAALRSAARARRRRPAPARASARRRRRCRRRARRARRLASRSTPPVGPTSPAERARPNTLRICRSDAGRVSPRERRRMNAAWSSSTVSGAMPSSSRIAQERRGREHVAHGFVRILEHDAAPLADRLQPMVSPRRLEQTERVERARDADGAVVDPARANACSSIARSNRALCATNTAPSSSAAARERSSRIAAQTQRPRRRSRAPPSPRQGSGPTGRTSRREPRRLDAVGVEPHDCERDDLVQRRASSRSSRSRTPRRRPAERPHRGG